MKASINLIKRSKAKIKGVIVLLELDFLKGRSKFKEKLISLENVSI
jgi:adenine/guanine phosphoribosyltransferase-like PRPP-binding protein